MIKYDTVVVHQSAVGFNQSASTGSGEELTVFPNPAQDYLELNILNTELRTATVLIHNSLGQLISKEVLQQTQQTNGIKNSVINIKDLPNGVYLLTLLDTASPTRSDNLLTVSKRFVIAR